MLFIQALMEKKQIFERLNEFGSKQKSKFMYQLLSCKFCIMTHTTIVVCFVVYITTEQEKTFLFVPFVVSGLLTLKRN